MRQVLVFGLLAIVTGCATVEPARLPLLSKEFYLKPNSKAKADYQLDHSCLSRSEKIFGGWNGNVVYYSGHCATHYTSKGQADFNFKDDRLACKRKGYRASEKEECNFDQFEITGYCLKSTTIGTSTALTLYASFDGMGRLAKEACEQHGGVYFDKKPKELPTPTTEPVVLTKAFNKQIVMSCKIEKVCQYTVANGRFDQNTLTETLDSVRQQCRGLYAKIDESGANDTCSSFDENNSGYCVAEQTRIKTPKGWIKHISVFGPKVAPAKAISSCFANGGIYSETKPKF